MARSEINVNVAKPILIVRINPMNTGASMDEIRDNYVKSTAGEYHVIVVNTIGLDYYPKIEVHSASNFGEITTHITGKDIIGIIDRGSKGRQRGT